VGKERGVLFRPQDHIGLSDALNQFIHSPSSAAVFGKAGRVFAERVSLERYHTALLAVYEKAQEVARV
jgi:hypothetical protein